VTSEELRLAWFSPLPPTDSGIADYTYELVPYVAGRARVDVFCPRRRFGRQPQAPLRSRALPPAHYSARPRSYDAALFHLGNNPHHEFVYRAARRFPGIAVFHDAVLHHLVAHMTVESGRDSTGYEPILQSDYGELGRRLATLRRDRLATDFEKFLFPLTAHVARRATGIVVHSEETAAWMGMAAAGVPLTVIPHHAGAPPTELTGVDRAEARRRLGLPPDAFVAIHLGFITRPKQPGALLDGFRQLHREFPDSLLVMVGADQTGGAVWRLAHRLGIAPAVKLTGYVDLLRMYLYMRAGDVMVNLRYPSAGETSGTLARSLAEGRVVIVNNYGSWAELPRDVALKVEIDGPQGEQVGAHLLKLARDPLLQASMEEQARRYASAHLDPTRCAEQYVDFVRRVGNGAA
jgi:glycosyltransferase involved in cell wall biosynthesis